MGYYIRAKEFVKNLLKRIQVERPAFKMGDRWKGRFSFHRMRERLRRGIPAFDTERWQRQWRDGVGQLGRGLNRQNVTQLKAFQSIKNFDYENFFDRVFSPQSYRVIHQTFLVILFVVVTYGLGKMASYALLPAEKSATYKANHNLEQLFVSARQSKEWDNMQKTDLFRTESGTNKPKGNLEKKKIKVDVNLSCDDSSKRSSLPLKLINAVVLQNRKKSVASVEGRNKKEMLYLREGDSVENITVKKISWPKMIFINHQTGGCEYIVGKVQDSGKLWRRREPRVLSPEAGRKLIESKKDENVVKVGNTFQIKEELKEEILDNINMILTQAKAIEIKNPDGSLCFKMVDIVPGSPYSTFDIQNNDIICNINGKKIDDLNSLFALFGKMRDIKHFEMVIRRDGQEIPMEYNFE